MVDCILIWLVNVLWLVIFASYQHILQMFSTAARLVRAHLEFCKSWVNHSDICCFRGMTYVALRPTLCFKLISFVALIFALFNH